MILSQINTSDTPEVLSAICIIILVIECIVAYGYLYKKQSSNHDFGKAVFTLVCIPIVYFINKTIDFFFLKDHAFEWTGILILCLVISVVIALLTEIIIAIIRSNGIFGDLLLILVFSLAFYHLLASLAHLDSVYSYTSLAEFSGINFTITMHILFDDEPEEQSDIKEETGEKDTSKGQAKNKKPHKEA